MGLLWKYTSGTQDWRYRYSASGEREQKRNYAGTKTWTYYLLGGDKRQLAVYEGVESEVDPCNDNMLTPPPSRSVYLLPKEYLTYGGATHNLTTKPSGEKEYKIADHLGNTRLTIEKISGTVKTYDYEPFGAVLSQNSPVTRLSFIDKEKDKESGLGDFGVRKYDDDLGRFLSVDPLWEKFRNLTPYNYSENNPVLLKDPNGDCPWCWGFLIGAGVEYGSQVIENLAKGKELGTAMTDVNGDKITIAGIAGVVTGGLSAVAKGVTAKVVISSTVSVAEGYGKAKVSGEKYTVTQVATDAVLGGVAAYGSEKAGKYLANTQKGQALEKSAEKLESRAAKHPDSKNLSNRSVEAREVATQFTKPVTRDASASAGKEAVSKTIGPQPVKEDFPR